MDPRLLEKYNQELLFLRQMGVEFAQEYPKIAAQLDLGGTECADPYVERLLEGFAFLTARLRVKMDAAFPDFSQHLLQILYPHYLAPLPATTLLQIEPDLNGGISEQGFLLPKGTILRSTQSLKGHTRPSFSLAHAVQLWPIMVQEAHYWSRGQAYPQAPPQYRGIQAAIHLRLKTVNEIPWSALVDFDRLDFYLQGSGDLPTQIYELLIGHCIGIKIQPAPSSDWQVFLDSNRIQAQGFEPEQAMLPYPAASFQGYRLLQEYFMLPERYLFFSLSGLQPAAQRQAGTELDIIIFLDQNKPELEDLIEASHFALYCSPAINLFRRRTDRLHIDHKQREYHLVVDNTRPQDYEIYSIEHLWGYRSGTEIEQEFYPFYALQAGRTADRAYYTLKRKPSLRPIKHHQDHIIPYLGSEVYISLVDAQQAPYAKTLTQLGAEVYCSNRGLSQFILTEQEMPEFQIESGAPILGARCLTKISPPRFIQPDGQLVWRLISHLSLNYLSLLQEQAESGAKALRALLSLYAELSQPGQRKQIEGILNIHTQTVVRRLPMDGPMAFARGLQIDLELNEAAYQGTGAFLMAAVLERFFAQYVSINSFTQMRLHYPNQGLVMTWPVRIGKRQLI